MTKKQRIIRFITYYKTRINSQKGYLKSIISEICEYKGNTFNYKLNHRNYKIPEIEKIEKIIEAYKNKTIENLIQDYRNGKIKVL